MSRSVPALAAVLLFSPLAAVVLPSCASPGSQAQSRPFATAGDQIAHGGEVFAGHCAGCHGNAGQGTDDAPALVGSTALAGYGTALDVAHFATQNMPPTADARRKLVERDYWAVLAFCLTANGVSLDSTVGPNNAGRIALGR